jgi:hypothetical protein
VWFSIFCNFCRLLIIHLVYAISRPFWSVLCRILDVADAANVFVANSISQSIVNGAA